MSKQETVGCNCGCWGITAGGGISLGGLLAALCSWSVNHSILWALVHLFCSWGYVIYWLVMFS